MVQYIAEPALPAGLELNPNTGTLVHSLACWPLLNWTLAGVLSGTPRSILDRTQFTISAINRMGSAARKTITIKVATGIDEPVKAAHMCPHVPTSYSPGPNGLCPATLGTAGASAFHVEGGDGWWWLALCKFNGVSVHFKHDS